MINYIQPLIGMVGVTAGVWSYMYLKRLIYLSQNQVPLEQIDTPSKLDNLIPASVNLPSYNLKNLFEAPVVFYALCIASEIQRSQGLLSAQDWLYQVAWAYVLLRLAHSVIHCTYNNVMHRFIAYFLSSIVLWLMAIRVAVIAFG